MCLIKEIITLLSPCLEVHETSFVTVMAEGDGRPVPARDTQTPEWRVGVFVATLYSFRTVVTFLCHPFPALLTTFSLLAFLSTSHFAPGS